MKLSISSKKVARIGLWSSIASAAALIASMVVSAVLHLDWRLVTLVALVTMLVQVLLAFAAHSDNLERALAFLRDAGLIELEEPLSGEQRVLINAVGYGGTIFEDFSRALVERCLGRKIAVDEVFVTPFFAEGYSVRGDCSFSTLMLKGERVWHFRFQIAGGFTSWRPVISSALARELDVGEISALLATLKLAKPA